MLVKKELMEIPLCSSKSPRNNAKYFVATKVVSLKRSGEVLVADFFNANDLSLKIRFFCDGNSYLECMSWPPTKWTRTLPENILAYANVVSTESDTKLARSFFKSQSCMGVYDAVKSFTREICEANYQRRNELEQLRTERLFNSLPNYPEDLPEYCEKHIFKTAYLFIGKLDKGKRSAACGRCEGLFTIGKEVRQGSIINCPECGTQLRVYGVWLQEKSSVKDTAKVCIAHRVNGQLYMRWFVATRTYCGTKPQYNFNDYYRNFYQDTKRGSCLHTYINYNYNSMGYTWSEWRRKKKGKMCFDETFVYTNNLAEVFGESYCYVNLQQGLQHVNKINFSALLNNLESYQSAEYLFKLGLVTLAASSDYLERKATGSGFSGLLGVSKQYLPLYRKYDVNIVEHLLIKAAEEWIDEDLFCKLRALKIRLHHVNDLTGLMKKMPLKKLISYFYKQRGISRRKDIGYLFGVYKDYIDMLQSLGVDLSRKSVKFPADLCKAHDITMQHYNSVIHAAEEESFKEATRELYSHFPHFERYGLCIILPQSRADFLREGQSLNHCVGADRYFKAHMEGTRLILFVRKQSERAKPYFTMELDTSSLKILQLYGFSGCSPSREVKKFGDEFVHSLSDWRGMEKVAN